VNGTRPGACLDGALPSDQARWGAAHLSARDRTTTGVRALPTLGGRDLLATATGRLPPSPRHERRYRTCWIRDRKLRTFHLQSRAALPNAAHPWGGSTTRLGARTRVANLRRMGTVTYCILIGVVVYYATVGWHSPRPSPPPNLGSPILRPPAGRGVGRRLLPRTPENPYLYTIR
jgi:hypothetical protein